MCVLIFSTNFIWKISHSKKKWERYCRKCVLIFMQSIRYSCEISRKLESSRQVFEKYSSQILWKSVQWQSSCSMRTKSRRQKGDTKRAIHWGGAQDLCNPELSNGMTNAGSFASPRLKMFVRLFYSFLPTKPLEKKTFVRINVIIWCDFDRASSLICGNKMPTRCNRVFLLQILLLAQHVSGTTMPIIRSSSVLYSGCCKPNT